MSCRGASRFAERGRRRRSAVDSHRSSRRRPPRRSAHDDAAPPLHLPACCGASARSAAALRRCRPGRPSPPGAPARGCQPRRRPVRDAATFSRRCRSRQRRPDRAPRGRADAPLSSRRPRDTGADGPSLAFSARADGRDSSTRRWSRHAARALRSALRNDLDEPTVAHWHGLTMDTRNDGNGESLIAPGGASTTLHRAQPRRALLVSPAPARRDRAPGASGPVRTLRRSRTTTKRSCARALELVPGETEIPLVLHEARRGAGYATRRADDLRLGWFGDVPLVNFTPRPDLDVATRRYRLRILNAATRAPSGLASRDDGAPLPFQLLGTDGGLLEQRGRCTEVLRFTGGAHRRPGRLLGDRCRRLRAARKRRVRPDARGAGTAPDDAARPARDGGSPRYAAPTGGRAALPEARRVR